MESVLFGIVAHLAQYLLDGQVFAVAVFEVNGDCPPFIGPVLLGLAHAVALRVDGGGGQAEADSGTGVVLKHLSVMIRVSHGHVLLSLPPAAPGGKVAPARREITRSAPILGPILLTAPRPR